MNRREFLRRSGVVAAGLVIPSALTSCATLGTARARRPAPSGRVNLGIIGFGTIAFSNVPNFLADPRVQVVAVADPVVDLPNYGYQGERRGGRTIGQSLVNDYYAEATSSGRYRGCSVFEDFREMLAREDIDAVYIATPDHWHCAAAVLAARKGKHIYGQKPLALTVAEGRRIVRSVEAAGVTWQTGAQQRSSIHFRTACEFVRNGRIGRVQHIKVGFSAGHDDWSGLAARNRPEPVPAGLNYDLWLGPAPLRDYRPALLPLNWRHNWDFSGGFITDWGAHHFDIVQWALGMDRTGPVSIENAVAALPAQSSIYNTPTGFSFEFVYANGVRVSVSDQHRNGILFLGENGQSIFVARGILEVRPAELRREKIGAGEIHLYESNLHERNFIDCIYDGRPTISPAEVGHRSITIAHLTNIAIRLGRPNLRWDPLAEHFPDDSAANSMLSRSMRPAYAV